MVSVTADDAVNTVVMVAQAACDFAVCFGETIEMSMVMGRGSGGPFAMGEGSVAWLEAASSFAEAQQTLTSLHGGLSSQDWSGDDRNGFDTEMDQLAQQLGDAHGYAEAVGITLGALTVPLAAWPIACATIGAVEASNAAAFYSVAATIVGDFGPAEAIWAEGEAVTVTCASVLNWSAVALTALMAAGTAAIVVADALDVVEQTKHGDSGALGDLGQATVDSSLEAAINVAVDRVNNRTKHEEPSTGRHEGPAKRPGGPTEPHAPRHLKPPTWEKTYAERRKEFLKEKAAEKGGDGLNELVHNLPSMGAKKIDPNWDDPDAPKPGDENWGHDGDDQPPG